MPFIRCVRAFEDETVEIRWRCRDGSAVVQPVTIPPPDVRADLLLAEQLLDEVAAARNAAGQVIERPHTNAAGQRYLLPSSSSSR